MEKEEAIKVLNDYMGGKIDPESTELYHAIELVVDILESQPCLPYELDEAEEKYAWQKEEPLAEGERLSTCFNPRIEAFKAGGKWMAEQGVSTIAIVSTENEITEEGMKLIEDYWESLPDKTEVVLQIRKK